MERVTRQEHRWCRVVQYKSDMCLLWAVNGTNLEEEFRYSVIIISWSWVWGDYTTEMTFSHCDLRCSKTRIEGQDEFEMPSKHYSKGFQLGLEDPRHCQVPCCVQFGMIDVLRVVFQRDTVFCFPNGITSLLTLRVMRQLLSVIGYFSLFCLCWTLNNSKPISSKA